MHDYDSGKQLLKFKVALIGVWAYSSDYQSPSHVGDGQRALLWLIDNLGSGKGKAGMLVGSGTCD